jgi:hypothetical protein
VAKPVKLAQKYPTWGAWVDSGDWATSSPTGTLTLPANASEIMILALDPDVSVTQLARVTSRDQVLAGLALAPATHCHDAQPRPVRRGDDEGLVGIVPRGNDSAMGNMAQVGNQRVCP